MGKCIYRRNTHRRVGQITRTAQAASFGIKFAGNVGEPLESGSLLKQVSTPAMALGATIYVFDIRLADADRNLYETLSFRVARHPSESEEYLLTRVLAYCLEFGEGLAFSSGGISSPDEPALAIRDLTGVLKSWIDIGSPEAARLHKASKATPRVAVYAHKDIDQLLARLQGEHIHRADAIELYAMDRELLTALAAKLQRRMTFDLSIAERTLYVTLGDETLTGDVRPHRIGPR
jgi:uncharacterized protein YaeQ